MNQDSQKQLIEPCEGLENYFTDGNEDLLDIEEFIDITGSSINLSSMDINRCLIDIDITLSEVQLDQSPMLENCWTVYDHEKSDKDTYEKSTRMIGEFGDVVKFWQVINYYPSPGEIFNNGSFKPGIKGREISSVSIFKKGILPKWEDPQNMYGGEISKRRFNKKNPMEELEEDWYNLLMACVGETMDPSVTGIRIVDSSMQTIDKKSKVSKNYKLLFRIELWFSDKSKKNIIEKQFRTLLQMNDDDNIYYKDHILPANLYQ
jgi:hypothetical protein